MKNFAVVLLTLISVSAYSQFGIRGGINGANVVLEDENFEI